MTNKFKYFVANWKMFGNLAALKSFKNFKNSYLSLKAPKRNKIILCLPSTLIYSYKRNFKSKHILIDYQIRKKDYWFPYNLDEGRKT